VRHDINEAVPTSLNHLVGNRHAVDQVRRHIDAVHQDNLRFPHTAMLGGMGLGKTTMARVISNELAVSFHSVLGQSLTKPRDLNALLLRAEEKSIVFIDEAHEMPRSVQTALYTCIDEQVLTLSIDGEIDGIPLNNFCLMLGTTDEDRLLAPLLSRMKVRLHFEMYSKEDLTKIASIRARALGWECEDGVLEAIAARSNSIAREALKLLESSRRMSRASGANSITIQHLEEACAAEGICSAGLTRRDRRYLRFLLDGPQRVNVLGSLMGIKARTLEVHIEPTLIRNGFLTKNGAGQRVITAKARQHLKEVGDE
jgi:Holliday junction DNA helicase RuvB